MTGRWRGCAGTDSSALSGSARMRRVPLTFAALMTTFTADSRARRGRFYAASRAGGDDFRLALGAIHLGPDRLPIEAFSDRLHESLLA
jgi:hypothetical protein